MTAADESDWVFRDRHPERVQVYDRYDRLSATARSRPEAQLDQPYGSHPRERMDLFPGPTPDAPVVVFFHGGYWQSQSKERFSFVADSVHAAGFSAALIGYPLAPEYPMPGIVEAASRAVDAALGAFSIPPESWIAAGHSAGGHLALCAARVARSVPLAGVAALSPICDLAPLSGTSLDGALQLTPQFIRDLSPLRQAPPSAPVRIWVGGDETPGFLTQARVYAAQMQGAGGEVSVTVLDGLNHYTVPGEVLASPSHIITGLRALCRDGKRGLRPQDT